MRYPWPCRGCGGPVELRPAGRTAYACSGKCRSAAWRDEQAGRTGAELAERQAARRAARAREPARLTPGEQAVIRHAWLAAIVACYASRGSHPALREAMTELSWDVADGDWPEPVIRAARAGLWPGVEDSEGIAEAVISERMKLLALRRGTQRGRRTA